jgi:hypothetical protein
MCASPIVSWATFDVGYLGTYAMLRSRYLILFRKCNELESPAEYAGTI